MTSVARPEAYAKQASRVTHVTWTATVSRMRGWPVPLMESVKTTATGAVPRKTAPMGSCALPDSANAGKVLAATPAMMTSTADV